jgi:hypothetical protein
MSRKELAEIQTVAPSGSIVSVQEEYNLFDRTIENDILPYCQRRGLTAIAYSPLDQGKIASGDRRIKILRGIAKKYDKTMFQIALNWLVSHDGVIAIPKAADPRHVRQNAAAADFDMSIADITAINHAFVQQTILVLTGRINVVPDGQGNRQVYRTLKEALANRLGLVPGPAELAQDIRRGDVLKPVRVRKSADKTDRYDYDLVEGRVRYWAWVIAYKGKKPIPILIRDK